MLKIGKVVVRVVVVFICIMAVLFAVAVMTAHFNGYSFGTITSGSMEPTLEKGDAVLLSDDTGDIEEGDIIVFDSDTSDIPVCHRVVMEFPDDRFVTKGDANDVMDNDVVYRSNVIGEVRCKIPLFGRVLEFCRSSIGIVTMIICSSATLLAIAYRNRSRIIPHGDHI